MSGKVQPTAPSNGDLQEMLGASYKAFETFLESHSDLRQEWKYYGPNYGWSLKLFHGKRNLCFITPYPGYFAIAFVLGGRAVEAAAASTLPQDIKQQIADTRAYAEGRGVRLEIKTERDLAPAETLLEIKRSS